MYNDDPLRQPGPHTRNLAIATANRYLPTEREGRKLLLKRTEVPVVKLRLSVMISLLVPSAVAALQTPGVEAQGGFSSSNGVLEVKPGEARQETPFLPALAGTLP